MTLLFAIWSLIWATRAALDDASRETLCCCAFAASIWAASRDGTQVRETMPWRARARCAVRKVARGSADLDTQRSQEPGAGLGKLHSVQRARSARTQNVSLSIDIVGRCHDAFVESGAGLGENALAQRDDVIVFTDG